MEKLQKDYPWLFFKKVARVDGKKRVFDKVELNPVIIERETHFEVIRETNASPLILSKGYFS